MKKFFSIISLLLSVSGAVNAADDNKDGMYIWLPESKDYVSYFSLFSNPSISFKDNTLKVMDDGNTATEILFREGIKISFGAEQKGQMSGGVHEEVPVTSDSGFRFAFKGVFGDVNSDYKVSMKDANLILGFMNNKFSPISRAQADIDGDGIVTVADAKLASQIYLGELADQTIYAKLKNGNGKLVGTFNTFLRLAEDLNSTDVLMEDNKHYYKVFPANDDAFARFFAGGNNVFGKSSYDKLTYEEKSRLFWGAVVKNYEDSNGDVFLNTLDSWYYHREFVTKDKWPVSDYFAAKNYRKDMCLVYDNTSMSYTKFTGDGKLTTVGDDSDFSIITGRKYEPNMAVVNNTQVLTNPATGEKAAMQCSNGEIFQIENVNVNLDNMAQVLRSSENMKHVSRMLDYFAVPYYFFKEEEDSVFAVRYLSKYSQNKVFNSPVLKTVIPNSCLLTFDPGWNDFKPSISELSGKAAMLVPTDKALEDYFSNDGAYILKTFGAPGISCAPADLHNTLDQHLDAMYRNNPELITSLLNNMMFPDLSKAVPSKFAKLMDQNNNFLNASKADLHKGANGEYAVHVANNGVIYEMDKVYAPEIYGSVLGPVSLSPDTKIMGTMLMDHSETVGYPATFGADMYYYLTAVQSKFALLVPTDNDDFYYIDPASKFDYDGMKALKFVKTDNPNCRLGICVQVYMYDRWSNTISDYPLTGIVPIETGYFNTQIQELMNSHTIVLDNMNGLGGNHYYKTKNGAAIYVPDATASNVNSSTIQVNPDVMNSTVTGVQSLKNGTIYQMDRPVQPVVKSVFDVLSEHYAYEDFLTFLEGFSECEDALYAADILSYQMDRYEMQAVKKQWAVFGDNNEMTLLNAYNYTIYAPKNMMEAYRNGLPTWSEVRSLVEEINSTYNAQDEITMKRQLKEKLTKMRDFVRYHVQEGSVFVDTTVPSEQFPTVKGDQLGIPQSLSWVKNGSSVAVKDEVKSGRSFTPTIVDANMMAREVAVSEERSGRDVEGRTFMYKNIVSSSFVVIHGIDKPLCYNSNYRY